MTAEPSPQELVERALGLSRTDGCVVIAEEVVTANLRWAANTLTTNGIARDRQVTVIAVSGEAAGVVSRQDVTVDSLEETVRDAERTARAATPSEDRGPLVSGSARGWETPPAESSIGVFAGLAPALGDAFERAGASRHLLFGYAEHEVRTTYVGTSAGLRVRHEQPTGHLEINAKSDDHDRSAWAGVPAATFAGVDVEALTGGLAERLAWAERRVSLPPGRYETILPPSAVADLMISLYWSAGARDAHDGRTVFSRPGGGTRVGDRLGDVALSLRSDPADTRLRCAPFVVAHESSAMQSVYDNGFGLAPTAWIADGTLAALVQTRHSAQMTGLAVTPYVDNLIVDGAACGPAGVDAMIGRTERGLLLTCLWYIREVDPQTLLLTGLTRDGVYLVEGGEVVGAVNNFRFNESPVDVLGRVVEAGSSGPTLPREWCDYFTRTAMPPLRVADFNMSSVSRAI